MKANTSLSNAAQIAIAFKVDEMRGIRATAATYLSRMAYEFARDGQINGGVEQERRIEKLCRRFRLGDYFSTVVRGYQDDFAAQKVEDYAVARIGY